MRTYKEIPTLLSKALLGTLSGEEECSAGPQGNHNPLYPAVQKLFSRPEDFLPRL